MKREKCPTFAELASKGSHLEHNSIRLKVDLGSNGFQLVEDNPGSKKKGGPFAPRLNQTLKPTLAESNKQNKQANYSRNDLSPFRRLKESGEYGFRAQRQSTARPSEEPPGLQTLSEEGRAAARRVLREFQRVRQSKLLICRESSEVSLSDLRELMESEMEKIVAEEMQLLLAARMPEMPERQRRQSNIRVQEDRSSKGRDSEDDPLSESSCSSASSAFGDFLLFKGQREGVAMTSSKTT